MGRYWTATELAQRLPQPVLGTLLINATSRPVSASQFEQIIGEIEAEFDGAAAAAGYAAPIPSSASSGAFEYVRMVVSYGARWQALEQIKPGSSTADEMKFAYRRAIEEVRSGRQPLLNVGGDSGEGGRNFPRFASQSDPLVSRDWTP